jgi:hypothetical protein
MATIEIVIDNLILLVLYVAGVYGLIVLFWNVVFPMIAEDEPNDKQS